MERNPFFVKLQETLPKNAVGRRGYLTRLRSPKQSDRLFQSAYRAAADANRMAFFSFADSFKAHRVENTPSEMTLLDQAEQEAVSDKPAARADQPVETVAKVIDPVVEWARRQASVFDSFSRKPKIQPGRSSGPFFAETARFLRQHPVDIPKIVDFWNAGDKINGYDQLLELVENEVLLEGRKRWKSMTDTDLSVLVVENVGSAGKNTIVKALLKGFFQGPSSMAERIEALYKFTSDTINLVTLPIVLKEALRILYFETEFVPLDSGYKMDMVLLGSGLVADDDLTRMAVNLGTIKQDLSRITNFDHDTARALGDIYIQNNLATWHERKQLERRRALNSGLTEEAYQVRQDAMKDLARVPFIAGAAEAPDVTLWPYTLMSPDVDPLKRRYVKMAAAFVKAIAYAREVKALLPAQERRGSTWEHIMTPDGRAIYEVIIPGSLIGRKGEVFGSTVIPEIKFSDDMWRDLASSRVFQKLLTQRHSFEGLDIFGWWRMSAGIEQRKHSLVTLATVGIPVPFDTTGYTDDEIRQKILSENATLVSSIPQFQTRFLMRRGFRVPATPEEKRIGYQHFDYHKDPTDPTQVIVRVPLGNLGVYQIKLDQSFGFNTEGMELAENIGNEFLRNKFLRDLAWILCKRRLSLPGMTEIGGEVRIRARVGHCRFLPTTKHKTDRARLLYKEHEGEKADLDQKERDRKALLVAQNLPDLNTTYVKPVTADADEVGNEPIEIQIPEGALVNFEQELRDSVGELSSIDDGV